MRRAVAAQIRRVDGVLCGEMRRKRLPVGVGAGETVHEYQGFRQEAYFFFSAFGVSSSARFLRMSSSFDFGTSRV